MRRRNPSVIPEVLAGLQRAQAAIAAILMQICLIAISQCSNQAAIETITAATKFLATIGE
jgi:hypothetical protein